MGSPTSSLSADGGTAPERPTTRRGWPFELVLVGFVALLGLLPHARFSLALGEPLPFFAAYDEPAYTLWAFEGGGPFLPHRFLSSALLRTLAWASGSSGTALVLADLLFPMLCALLAWRLSGHVTRRRTLRLATTLGLLFSQELFSLGCWTIWQARDPLGVPDLESAVYDLRDVRVVAPGWLARLWPDYSSPFLALFRTPEPQMSLILLYGILSILLELCREPTNTARWRRLVALAVAVNLALVASYFFVAAAIVVLEGTLCLALLAWRRRETANWVGALAIVGAASLLASVLAFHSGTTSQEYGFGSRLPVLTPATVVAALSELLLVLRLRASRAHGEGLPIAAACFGSVLFLTNQQLLSGRMISTQHFERFVDYPLVGLGSALTGAWLLRQRQVRVHMLYALAGAGLLAAAILLLRAQDRVFEEEFLVPNLKSVAASRAVLEAEVRGLRDPLLVLEDPDLDLAIEARLGRRVRHLLDLSAVFDRPVEPLATPGGHFGRRSPFAREAFEYFARRPRTAAAVERALNEEADAGAGVFLRFFFDARDFWTTFTDGRAAKLAEVRSQLPSIRGDLEEYLRAGDPCWGEPAVVLTRQNAAERMNPRWHEQLLVEVTVGRERPLMNMHAYLQTPSPEAPLGGGSCVRAEPY